MPACRQCQQQFEVTQDDLAFLESISPVFGEKKELIPPPNLCPRCRMQRRFAFRNERSLHRRTCDMTGNSLISFFRADAPYKVYEKDAWWSDAWDALSYGKEVNLSESFFDQFAKLRDLVPRLGMLLSPDEGSAYSPYCMYTKRCYMCVSCVVNEDSLYCYQANDSKDCADCSNVTRCERCYECVYCFNLQTSSFCKDCENGSGLLFCQDCRGCSDCIGCKNLVNKKFHVFNQPVDAKEFEALRSQLSSHASLQKIAEQFRSLALALPTRASHITACENSTGDHLRNCKNIRECFDAMHLEDCSFVCPCPQPTKDAHGAHYSPQSELIYDCMSAVRSSRMRFSLHSWDSDDITYCDECYNSHSLFGCIGLRHKEYCILNKQYTKEEYDALVPKIIEGMRKTPLRFSGASEGQVGEWGEYPPIAQSPFAYNDTIAQDEFPLTKEEVLARGWKWQEEKDEMPKVAKVIDAEQLPDSIDDIPDDVLNWAIRCEKTLRPFKLIKQELEFYRSMRLPVPRLHPDERYRGRVTLRNPRKLWKRPCMKCEKEMLTTYAPERREKLYCEVCYLKEVY